MVLIKTSKKSAPEPTMRRVIKRRNTSSGGPPVSFIDTGKHVPNATDPEEFREKLQKNRLEDTAEYQRRKLMSEEQRGREAIDLMTKDAMRLKEKSGEEGRYDAERDKIVKVAERNSGPAVAKTDLA